MLQLLVLLEPVVWAASVPVAPSVVQAAQVVPFAPVLELVVQVELLAPEAVLLTLEQAAVVLLVPVGSLALVVLDEY